jgi:hypothetical protein
VRDVVTAAGIGEQLVEQVAVLVAIPQMMMRVNDLERRFQNLLFPLCPPGRIAVAPGGELPGTAVAGLVWALTAVGRSKAPPSTPAVPTSIVRRDTERRRTVSSVIALPPCFSDSNQT